MIKVQDYDFYQKKVFSSLFFSIRKPITNQTHAKHIWEQTKYFNSSFVELHEYFLLSLCLFIDKIQEAEPYMRVTDG